MYKKRKKTRRYDDGGINNPPIDKDKLNAAIDTLNTFMAKDLGGNFGKLHQGHSDQVQHSLYNKPFGHPINKGGRIDEVPRLIESMKKLEGEYGTEGYNQGVPDVDINALVRNIKYLESLGDVGKPYLDSESISLPERKAAGGMVDDDGGIEPTQQDSLNASVVQDFISSPYESKMRAILGTAPAENSDLYDSRLEELFASNKKVGPLTPEEKARMNALAEQRIKDLESKNFGMGGTVDNSNQPDSLTNYIKGNDKYRMGGVPNDDNFSDMGGNMKHGGMVNKSKGNRDQFTNQYD